MAVKLLILIRAWWDSCDIRLLSVWYKEKIFHRKKHSMSFAIPIICRKLKKSLNRLFFSGCSHWIISVYTNYNQLKTTYYKNNIMVGSGSLEFKFGLVICTKFHRTIFCEMHNWITSQNINHKMKKLSKQKRPQKINGNVLH